jgi:hypothetical protein
MEDRLLRDAAVRDVMRLADGYDSTDSAHALEVRKVGEDLKLGKRVRRPQFYPSFTRKSLRHVLCRNQISTSNAVVFPSDPIALLQALHSASSYVPFSQEFPNDRNNPDHDTQVCRIDSSKRRRW